MDQQNLPEPYCEGKAACKNTCPGNEVFDKLEMDTVVFENGQYFKFEDFEGDNLYSFLQELPKIEDKKMLKSIFCDIENTLGHACVIKNDDGTLIWEY